MLKSLPAILMLTLCAFAQEPPPAIRGTWTATAGPNQVFRGNWSAAFLSSTSNAAQGSWVLLNNANQVVLEGTWSAEKSARGWQGRWSARIATGRASPRGSSAGRLVSGTWQAEMKDPKTKSLAELLQRTLQDQITGSWRSGGLEGHWWLKGTGDSTRSRNGATYGLSHGTILPLGVPV
jgi:hypothetical protein